MISPVPKDQPNGRHRLSILSKAHRFLLRGQRCPHLLSAVYATRDRAEAAYWLAGFFTCASAAFVWLLIRPRKLLLDGEGFTVSGGYTWRPTKILWQDVDDFFVRAAGRGGKVIGFTFKPPPRDPTHLADYVPSQTRMGTISLGWDQSTDQLVSELNRYRQKSPATLP